jgi:hypothetical protein
MFEITPFPLLQSSDAYGNPFGQRIAQRKACGMATLKAT